MILCWNEGQSSAVHDHSDSHCFMKVLKGGLSEIKYSWPQDHTDSSLITSLEPKCADVGVYQHDNDDCEQQLQEISRTSMNVNEVFYINGTFGNSSTIGQRQLISSPLSSADNIGLHRVENSSNTDVAVSLHLYCPPFDSCNVFNKAGKKTSAQVDTCRDFSFIICYPYQTAERDFSFMKSYLIIAGDVLEQIWKADKSKRSRFICLSALIEFRIFAGYREQIT